MLIKWSQHCSEGTWGYDYVFLSSDPACCKLAKDAGLLDDGVAVDKVRSVSGLHGLSSWDKPSRSVPRNLLPPPIMP